MDASHASHWLKNSLSSHPGRFSLGTQECVPWWDHGRWPNRLMTIPRTQGLDDYHWSYWSFSKVDLVKPWLSRWISHYINHDEVPKFHDFPMKKVRLDQGAQGAPCAFPGGQICGASAAGSRRPRDEAISTWSCRSEQGKEVFWTKNRYLSNNHGSLSPSKPTETKFNSDLNHQKLGIEMSFNMI